MNRARLLASLLVATAMVACQFLLDLPATASREDAAPSGGANDSGDGNVDGDAGVDSSGPLSYGPCDATFCDDFDDRDLPWTKWTGPEITRGLLALDDARAMSRPQSLLVTAPGYADQRPVAAGLHLDAGAPPAVSCAFSMFLEDVPQDGGAQAAFWSDFFEVRVYPPPERGLEYYRINFFTSPTNAGVRDDAYLLDGGCDCPRNSTSSVDPLPRQTWLRVQVDI